MRYHQITPEERYTLGLLRRQGCSDAEIASIMGRHRSTIGREIRRNCTNYDGAYRPSKAQEYANGRRWTPRRNARFGATEWRLIETLLQKRFSPEQVSGWLGRLGVLKISHETIYVHIWRDKHRGGQLWRHLRQPFKRRKRYASNERRGRVEGKRHISERPVMVDRRKQIGHWEMDTVLGSSDQHCIMSLVERVSGAVFIGKLRRRTAAELNARLIELIETEPHLFKTITADNGTEFHSYAEVEARTGVPIYFATPYHSWERGTNENTNGLLRQYLPKRQSMKRLTQTRCDAIAQELNNRPRKRHGYLTPIERLENALKSRRARTTR
jgi:IS30 family transposase